MQGLGRLIQCRLLLQLLALLAVVASEEVAHAEELAGAAHACESLRSPNVAPVLLQKGVRHGRSIPQEEASSALLEESQDNPSHLGQLAQQAAESLATGVGLINPLLQTSEEEYVNKGVMTIAKGPVHDEPHDEPDHDGNDSMVKNHTNGELLGDALEPYHAEHGEGKHSGHEHEHGHAALLFLFGGLTIGSLILMLHERFLQNIPFTVLLFMAGFLIALVHNLKPAHHFLTWTSWYDSVAMWKAINPHLLFYVFLPALVFSEAMRLNKQLVKSCFWQILLLAGPGVLIGTAMLGTFSHYVLPYGWDWPICLVIGSILSATDPVAVVALFNTLGVSPRLTMVISGESLLNDGTALVVFTLMLKVCLGAKLTAGGVAIFFGNMTIVSFLVGFCVASLALWIISCLALERGHSDAMIQVVITICCGYLCFFMAESELSSSGILSLVSSGFVLAYGAWPRFVSKEVVHIVWEAIEFVGNTMVFLLAGLLFADSCFTRIEHIFKEDLYWLIVMYLAAMGVRALLILILWIPLKLVGKPLSWREGLVMVWSGLRGAVSLAMAIIVDTEPAISAKMGTRVMFHVGGIAALTLIVNATTTARLLKFLGLTSEPVERERLLHHIERHLTEKTNGYFNELVGSETGLLKADLRFGGSDLDIVRSMVPSLSDSPSRRMHANARDTQALLAPPTDDDATLAARCATYREIFLQVIQNHYWEAIEQGIIPRNNRIARILVGSKDEALTDAATALTDWSHILPQVDIEPPRPGSWHEAVANLAHTVPWVPALPQIIPNLQVINTWKICAALSFQEAHKRARDEVPGYFDDSMSDDLDRQVKETVGQESLQSCQEADRLLEGVDKEAVSFGRSRMLAQKLLRLQLAEVQKLQHQGVLNNSEGHHLEESIHEGLLRIVKAETPPPPRRKP